MIKKVLICITAIIISITTAQSAEKMRLAVMDLQPKGVSKMYAATISDLLRSELVDTGQFIVIERSQMAQILKEQELQQTGCTDNACAVEMGKLLSANKMLVGEVNQLGTAIMITIRVVDVEKGVAEFSTNDKSENQNEIDKVTKKLVAGLTERITGKRVSRYEAAPAGYYWRGLVPGWGQIYGGSTMKGSVIMGLSFAAAGFLGYTIYNYNQKRADYDGMKPGTSQAEAKKLRSGYTDASTLLNIGIWSFIGMYTVNWIDLLFITDYKPGVSASLGSATFRFMSYQRQYNAVSREWCMDLGAAIHF